MMTKNEEPNAKEHGQPDGSLDSMGNYMELCNYKSIMGTELYTYLFWLIHEGFGPPTSRKALEASA